MELGEDRELWSALASSSPAVFAGLTVSLGQAQCERLFRFRSVTASQTVGRGVNLYPGRQHSGTGGGHC